MALTAGNPITASDVNSLATRIKNEMNRRNATGSLAGYASTPQSVSAGGQATAAQHNSWVTPVNAIKSVRGTVSGGSLIAELQTVSTRLSSNEGYSKTANSTDCASSCSGLCYTACSGGCRGCTNCSGTCNNTCKGCTNACSGCKGCTNACSGCKGCQGCTGCTNACSGCKGCTNACTGCKSCTGCSNACSGCKGTCKTECYGCTQNCRDGCKMNGAGLA